MAEGGPVRRYGQVIGLATTAIAAGDHVHTHNLAFGLVPRDYDFGADVRPVLRYPPEEMRYFDGYLRADGRVGTRNYVAVVSTVNCSASVSQFVKQRFADVSRDYPGVDGVIAITHKSGCAIEQFGEDHLALQRVLAGYAQHPNVAAYVVIGLGCEVNQAPVMVERQGMTLPLRPGREAAHRDDPGKRGHQEGRRAGGIRSGASAAPGQRGHAHSSARLRDHDRYELRGV